MMTELPTAFPTTGPTQCAYHPDTETRLRCSRCGKPICPRCGVRTPVGMRCPDCAGTRPTVAVNPAGTLRAAAAGLAVAAVVGVGWAFFPEWGFYWALLLGFGAVETMVHFLRGRTGFDLQAIAIAVVLFGVILSRVVLVWRLGIDVSDVNDFTRLAQRALYLRPIPDLLFAALPVLIAWIRFR
jgi:hypothetical protein